MLMTLAIVAESAPLQANEDGAILVGKTRVTLDTVVAVFNQGATAEEVVYRYPSLSLADVYATIAFYLKHQLEVEGYLQQRRQRSLGCLSVPVEICMRVLLFFRIVKCKLVQTTSNQVLLSK